MSQETTHLSFDMLNQLNSLLLIFSLGGDTHIDRVVFGVGGDGWIVAVQDLVQALFYGRFAKAGDAEEAREDRAASSITHEARHGLCFPHTVHLARHAGHGDDNMTILFDKPAGRGALRIG